MNSRDVNVVCRNMDADRVIPRFARYLADQLGWTLTSRPDPEADIIYLSGYFEWPFIKRGGLEGKPIAAYLTHREENPPGNEKAKLFDHVASQIDLRIATAAMYAKMMQEHGPTAQINPPVERGRFTIPKERNQKMTAGFSGFTYSSGRKGTSLAERLVAAFPDVEWRASGRGWPVKTRKYPWGEMPAFYQGLDVLVVTATVEGVPMPPLECLACGVSVVVPRGVGLLDELPDVDGIHRYKRGSEKGLRQAFREALEMRAEVDRQALREVTAPYSIAAWVEGHRRAFEDVFVGLEEPMVELQLDDEQVEEAVIEVTEQSSTRGIYCVAFGDPARNCAVRMMNTARKHVPEIPICLASDEPLGIEDVYVHHGDGPDSEGDIGGRRAKLRAYELSPPEWEAVLYLDVDTEIISPDVRFLFQLVEDGWEFVIAKDPHLMDTMASFHRANNLEELRATEREVFTLHTLQLNGGIWAFGRDERVAAFFQRWQDEYEKYVQRDQGALVRALYADPLKVFFLGNEWNWFQKYSKGVTPAAIKHYPGRARRWKGLIPGRIDSKLAWNRVEQFERRYLGRGRR